MFSSNDLFHDIIQNPFILVMCSPPAHCRLCAEPSPRLVGFDEVIDIKQKMLLVNVDVSAPSPLPRGACYSCLCLLDKTAAFRAQVSAAQDKLALIYQDNKDATAAVEESNMRDGFEVRVKQEPQDVTIEIEIDPCPDELPQEIEQTGMDPLDTVAIKTKLGPAKKYSKTNIESENRPLKTVKKEKKKVQRKRETETNTNKDKPEHAKGKRERKYLCECGTAWPSPAHLKLHQKIHTDRTRDFHCHVCGKAFLDNGALLGHLLLHKPKRFKCDVCGQGFLYASKLKTHAAKHSSERPFACDQCDKTFSQKRLLKTHSRVHTDVRPHVCSYCSKAFKTRQTFNVHVRLHTGARPYSCKYCGKGFYNHSNHHKHVRTVHGADPRIKKDGDTVVNSEEYNDNNIDG